MACNLRLMFHLLLQLFLILHHQTLAAEDFEHCIDDLDCDEGACCIAEVVGVVGLCLPCPWTIKSQEECHVTMNPCPGGYCCFNGVCDICLEDIQPVFDKELKDECHITMNPCPGGYCCFQGVCEIC